MTGDKRPARHAATSGDRRHSRPEEWDMSRPNLADLDRVREALTDAATTGGLAPSIQNTQPWRWKIRSGALELWSVPSRQLPVTDPDGRMVTISCGAALHHA